MQHWLIIVGNTGALDWILDTNQMAFRSHVPTEALKKGDRFAIYTARGAYGNPAVDESQILALGRLASAVEDRSVAVAGETFPKVCGITIEKRLPTRGGLPFRGLVGKLALVPTERQWSAAVRRTVAPLSEEDFGLISEAFDHFRVQPPG